MNNSNKTQSGFTLIELMIVIAIVAILVSLAVPAYQDYVVRSKVTECIYAAAPAKLAVSETWQTAGQLPTTDVAAGHVFGATRYCAAVSVGALGVITVTTQGTGAQGAAPSVLLTPLVNPGQGTVDWRCSLNAGEPRYLPRDCRA